MNLSKGEWGCERFWNESAISQSDKILYRNAVPSNAGLLWLNFQTGNPEKQVWVRVRRPRLPAAKVITRHVQPRIVSTYFRTWPFLNCQRFEREPNENHLRHGMLQPPVNERIVIGFFVHDGSLHQRSSRSVGDHGGKFSVLLTFEPETTTSFALSYFLVFVYFFSYFFILHFTRLPSSPPSFLLSPSSPPTPLTVNKKIFPRCFKV